MKLKILYAVQGTGNGHLARASAIIPCLEKHGKVDILISGTQADLELPYKVKFKFKGLSFIFGRSGGVDLWRTIARSNVKRLLKDIKGFPAENYNLIISDFEPVSSWACYVRGIPCVALSNQAVMDLNNKVQKGKMNWLGKLILMRYAPGTHKYGFHFNPNAPNTYTPLIRPEVRSVVPSDMGHITVYLPSYDDKKIIKHLSNFPETQFQVFSKHTSKEKGNEHIQIMPLNNQGFLISISSSSGVICGAGFETPSEALFLKKKLLVIPMKDQYEQQVNATILQNMGVSVIPKLKNNVPAIETWLKDGQVVPVDYPDRTQEIIDRIVMHHAVR